MTFDLVTSKLNRIIVTSVCIYRPSMKKIHQTGIELSSERAIYAYLLTLVTFDLMTPKSIQIVVTSVCIHVPSINKIHQTVLELSLERSIFAYLMTPVTFDLWPHDPKIQSDLCYLNMNTGTKYEDHPSNGSCVIVRTSYFYYLLTSVTFDLWPHDP